jgi:hypothetical protein
VYRIKEGEIPLTETRLQSFSVTTNFSLPVTSNRVSFFVENDFSTSKFLSSQP